MTWLWRRIGCQTLLLACLTACHPQVPAREASPARHAAPSEPKVHVEPIALEAPPVGVDWSQAADCRAMLRTLDRGLDDGSITSLDDTPFLLIEEQPSAEGGRWRAPAVRIGPDSSAHAPSTEARCVLRVGRASEQRSDHRVLGREQVRSRYQSGTRSEKNPAYEVAKARLRQAEKAAKPGKSSLIKVGDPLIDLVGTLVGGALTGLGQWGSGDQLEESLDALMATPPSIEHPVYKSYHFERARIAASREADLVVILTDRWLQKSWQASLKRRERRDLFVLTGLDREDEDYARHSQDGLSENGLQQWLAEPPSLPLADMVTALLDRPSTSPTDRLALADPMSEPGDTGPLADDASLDAAALPPPALPDVGRGTVDTPFFGGGASASRIGVIGETANAEGVYIAPHFILTPSDVIGKRGLVDIEDGSGQMALGLVAAVDRGLGLALIQAPAPGRPAIIGGSARPSETERSGRWGKKAAASSSGSRNRPILIGDELIGFRTAEGPDIEGDAIRLFIDRQRHLLPIGREPSRP